MNYAGHLVDEEGNIYYPKQEEVIQHGTFYANVPATSYTQYTVAFPKQFSDIPTVVATPGGNYNIICQLNNITKSEFKINVRSVDGNQRDNRWFYWIAIGKG